MPVTIKTIIFDLSEVLISGLCGVEESLARRFDRAPSEVLSALGGELLLQLCRGELSENTYLESVIANTGWEISVDELKQSIRVNFRRKVADMENILEGLAAHYELVLLSDHAKEWVEHIHDLHPHLRIFKMRVYSFQIGQTKRETSTFERLLGMINRRSEECIFIDDNISNIECARRVGFQTFHFSDAQTLLGDLKRASIFCGNANSAP
ncbi:MAG: HAD-superfamily hydrolase, subfamily variant 3 [Verrucomicrobiales bacterium]|nr:HAD-superfamily hydrolase, subfamily variant 3 [Verrucomicrobiales bacterium]